MTTTADRAPTDAAAGAGPGARGGLHHGGDYQRLAERTTDPTVLRELARCDYPFVWHAVAENPAAPADVLAALADRRHSDHNDNLLLRLLAEHPATAGAGLDGVVDAVARRLAAGHRPYAAVLALAARTDLPAHRVEALGKLPGASTRLRRGLTRVLAARPAT
ncbi:hypothetical protein ACFVHB_25585 [Kitasatospora sp. NPDC127111]|uniref:hypothetical protein n=1 Tax=Kitasatospora sp. NPDC127111 TaxID=3345363 RepID=UPI00362DF11B